MTLTPPQVSAAMELNLITPPRDGKKLLVLDIDYTIFDTKVPCATTSVSTALSHVTHVTRHTSHVTRHTSHVTRHTSHVTAP